MEFNRSLVAEKLYQWENYMKEYRLPNWEELPDFGLYMDQVIAFLSRYLDYIPVTSEDDRVLTVSAVNNYVRLKIMPAPVKKKYSRIHLAYLLMICTLKQNLSIANVQKLLPMNLSEGEVRERYEAFAAQLRIAAADYIALIRQEAALVLDPSGTQTDVDSLISSIAVQASLSKVLAEKLLNLKEMAQSAEKTVV